MLRDTELKPNEYAVIQRLLLKEAGIALGDGKQDMVKARLAKRLQHYMVDSYADYLKIVQTSKSERITFLNQLSTNETYFFREDDHFRFLEKLGEQKDAMRVWSAAASQGAEAYSAAMVLDRFMGRFSWSVTGSDINTEVLEVARRGLYPLSWLEKIPYEYQKRYCLKGQGRYEGKMLVDPQLQQNITFVQNNLMQPSYGMGHFDVVFLRNVLLYFTEEVKLQVVANILPNIVEGGYLIISMTENFDDTRIKGLRYLHSSIYQKVKQW